MEPRDVGPNGEFSLLMLDVLSALDTTTGEIGVKGLRNEGRCFRFELGIAVQTLSTLED